MKQLKVALPDDLRRKLETSAENSGRSLADEVRTRLERTFVVDSVDSSARDLFFTFDHLVAMVRAQTGYNWLEHPDAFRALRAAINARLDRLQPTEPLHAEPTNRPNPWIQSTDPETIGTAIEALSFMDAINPAGRANAPLPFMGSTLRFMGSISPSSLATERADVQPCPRIDALERADTATQRAFEQMKRDSGGRPGPSNKKDRV